MDESPRFGSAALATERGGERDRCGRLGPRPTEGVYTSGPLDKKNAATRQKYTLI